MDQPPRSYGRSSMAHSMPESVQTFNASSNYPSPVSATASQGLGFSPVGLGISGCGLDPDFNNLRAIPSAVPFAASTTAPSQMVPIESYYGITMKVDDFSRPCFSVYNSLPPASDSPISLYDSQNMGVSPSYNMSLEVGGQGTFTQTPGSWAPKPCSGPTTPPEAILATGHWDQSYFPESCITVNPPRLPVSSDLYHHTGVTGGSRPPTSHYHTAQLSSSPRSTTSSECVIPSSPQKVNKNRRCGKSQMDKDMDGGRKCRVCGFVFTRRSNCTEHEKRHDPGFKKVFCDECRKTFGRNVDLRRHIESASQVTGYDNDTC